jgi:hypothetical protein
MKEESVANDYQSLIRGNNDDVQTLGVVLSDCLRRDLHELLKVCVAVR